MHPRGGGPQVCSRGVPQRPLLPPRAPGPPRAGLPADVAALVTSIDPEATTVELVNLSPATDRTVIVQAGAFAEHTITGVRYTTCTDDGWIGDMYDYGHTEPDVTETEVPYDSGFLTVRLPASTRIRLTLRLGLRTRTPSYRTPFDGPNSHDTPGESA